MRWWPVWLMTRRAMMAEIRRLEAQIDAGRVETEAATKAADLAAELLAVHRDWLAGFTAAVRFKTAANVIRTDALRDQGGRQ